MTQIKTENIELDIQCSQNNIIMLDHFHQLDIYI